MRKRKGCQNTLHRDPLGITGEENRKVGVPPGGAGSRGKQEQSCLHMRKRKEEIADELLVKNSLKKER